MKEAKQVGDYNAILIVGPAGSGKRRMAVKEAKEIGGGYAVCLWDDIKYNRFGLGDVMCGDPKVVIVDWFSFGITQKEMAFIKSLVGGDSIIVEEKGLVPRLVEAPFFIFLSNDKPTRGELFRLVMRGWKIIEIESASIQVAKRALGKIGRENVQCACWLIGACYRFAKDNPGMTMEEFLSILEKSMPDAFKKMRDYLKQKEVIG